MRNEIIYKGLRLTSDKCRYFQVVEGKQDSIIEDTTRSTLTLTYSPGSSAKSLSVSLGLPLVGSGQTLMEPMSMPSRFQLITVSLNGLVLEKLTYDPHTINIVIADDSESRVVQTYGYTIFVISKDDYKNPEFIKFLFYSGNLLYLRPYGPRVKSTYELRNFPKIIVKDKSLNLTSDNSSFFTLRRRYNDYLIREIDYQDQFILEIRRILDDYGVELVRFNKETSLSKTSYITYQFNQTPIPERHPQRRDIERNMIWYKQPVEFTLHTTDMVMYHDFKNRYINVYLLTNFVEFKAKDKAGDGWTANVRWGQITEDFNHVYQADDNSNFALQCQFRCELGFTEVLDTRFEFLNEIITRLDAEDVNGEVAVEESKIIRK